MMIFTVEKFLTEIATFKYTELFIKLGSDYRVVVEEFKIGEFKSFHEILKIFK